MPAAEVKTEGVKPETEKKDTSADAKSSTPSDKGVKDDKTSQDAGKFSEETKTWAKEIGFSEEDINSYPSEQALEKVLVRTEKRFTSKKEESSDITDTDEEVTPPEGEKPKSKGKTETDDLELDPEEYDEKVIRKFKAQADKIAALEKIVHSNKGMNEKLTQHYEKMEEEQIEQITERVDNLFAELGDDYQHLFGKGKGLALPEGSFLRGNRERIVRAMDTIEKNRAVSQREKLTEPKLFARALTMEFEDDVWKIKMKKLGAKLDKRGESFSLLPSGRKGVDEDIDPLAKARQTERTISRKYGIVK
jgi:hypothetical protein